MPKIPRPNTKPLFLALDADVRAELDRMISRTGRTYKAEITFALQKHFRDGPQMLPEDNHPLKKERKTKEQ